MRGFSPWNVVFLAGLLLSVRVMVAGVERGVSAGQTLVRSRWAMLAGAATLSGFIGSLLARSGSRGVVFWASALASVLIGAWSARILVRRAAAMPVSDHEFDPRFELQGVPALVVQAIPADGDGLVRLPSGVVPGDVAIPARSLDGMPIASGIEVGVERIDAGVAFVESWAAIEARL
ncbi:MAG: hypothetical protein V4813_13630 [Gemmatimonadota bacterium]